MDIEYTLSAIIQLEEIGIYFENGLSDAEVEAVQAKYGFVFPPDLRLFLQTALPVAWPLMPSASYDHPFPNWRNGNEGELRGKLNWPCEGICFDIKHSRFWMKSWGKRPSSDEAAYAVARAKVKQAPTLIPIYGHRYLPDSPHLDGNPVYSVWQTDIIYYGFDLPSYLAEEFKIDNPYPTPQQPRRIDFWSSLPFMWHSTWV